MTNFDSRLTSFGTRLKIPYGLDCSNQNNSQVTSQLLVSKFAGLEPDVSEQKVPLCSSMPPFVLPVAVDALVGGGYYHHSVCFATASGWSSASASVVDELLPPLVPPVAANALVGGGHHHMACSATASSWSSATVDELAGCRWVD